MRLCGATTAKIPPRQTQPPTSNPQIPNFPPPPNMSDFEVLSIADLERIAQGKMDKMTREYYNSGADSEITQVLPHTQHFKNLAS